MTLDHTLLKREETIGPPLWSSNQADCLFIKLVDIVVSMHVTGA